MKRNILLNSELKNYIKDEMILEFNDLQELLDYVNYDCPEISEKVSNYDDVLKQFGNEYVFELDNKYYTICYNEALDILPLLPPSKVGQTIYDYTTRDFIAIIEEEELYTPTKIRKYFHQNSCITDDELSVRQENNCITIHFQANQYGVWVGTTMTLYIDKKRNNYISKSTNTRYDQTLKQCYLKASRIESRMYEDKHFYNYSARYTDNPNAITKRARRYKDNKKLIKCYEEYIEEEYNKIRRLTDNINRYSNRIKDCNEENKKLLER